MRRAYSLLAVVVLLAFAVVAGWQLMARDRLEARIPPAVKEAILARYDSVGREGIIWRAYAVQDANTFAVTEFRPTPTSPWTYLDVFRITGSETSPQLERWRIYWFGGNFEADCDYAEVDSDLIPHRQYAVGVALDKKIVRITATTEDGRTTSTVPFDGFWWMTSPMDPSNYVKDKWVKMTAFDAQGRVLYECVPRYPKFGKE